MHTFTATLTSTLALLTSAAAQDIIYFGSAAGYSGSSNDLVCEGNLLGNAIAQDGTSSECVNGAVKCIRASTTAGAGVFSGDCFVSVWSQTGCPGDAAGSLGITGGPEATFDVFNTQSSKITCQIT